jgi:hypothetical protein
VINREREARPRGWLKSIEQVVRFELGVRDGVALRSLDLFERELKQVTEARIPQAR